MSNKGCGMSNAADNLYKLSKGARRMSTCTNIFGIRTMDPFMKFIIEYRLEKGR